MLELFAAAVEFIFDIGNGFENLTQAFLESISLSFSKSAKKGME